MYSSTSMYSTVSPSWSMVLISRWYWCNKAMLSIKVRYFSWSRLVRVLSSKNVNWSAKGLITASGRNKLCAFRCNVVSCSFLSLFCSPAKVRLWRCAACIAWVCSLLSFTDNTKQRFNSSSSISIAVVVINSITGPSTRYSLVTKSPVLSSLPVLAIVTSPSDCKSFNA